MSSIRHKVTYTPNIGNMHAQFLPLLSVSLLLTKKSPVVIKPKGIDAIDLNFVRVKNFFNVSIQIFI
jgi:hypothetical protein